VASRPHHQVGGEVGPVTSMPELSTPALVERIAP
jgi:hypothetical protein